MMTVRGVTRRVLNAVMALHRRAIVREVEAARVQDSADAELATLIPRN